ncbi:MAG: rhamnan synthesis F [Xanthobacteraceae bacterium]|nr:rhamnan synthesis F [Xanthobacteraceae bacterium]
MRRSEGIYPVGPILNKVSDKKFLQELSIPFASTHFLEAISSSQNNAFIRVWIDDPNSRPLFIPASARTKFEIRTHRNDIELFFDRSEVAIEDFRPWRFLDFPKRIGGRRFRKFSQTEFDKRLTIIPLLHLSGPGGLQAARTMRTLAKWGFGISSGNLQDTLLYDYVEQEKGSSHPLEEKTPSTGIIIHLHYHDLWPDFERRLALVSLPFKLIVTLTADDPTLRRRIADRFPNSECVIYPNRGRDIGPFIQLWRDGHLNNLDLICKLHGKKSAPSGPRAFFGDIWRKSVLNDLVGSDAIVTNIVERFMQHPELGMVGSRRFHLPNRFMELDEAWGSNRECTLKLARALGFPEEEFRLDFFAGTMFWMRSELLDLLKPLDLSQNSFPEEAGQLDGTLHHALERLFGALPRASTTRMTTEDTVWRHDHS